MEEIRVNDFIRTKPYGEIYKVIGREQEDILLVDSLGNNRVGTGYVSKHSENIIDLIEVKDFIEVRIGDEVVSKFLIQDEHILESTRIYVREGSMKIIAVVTHQQFNSIKYEVE